MTAMETLRAARAAGVDIVLHGDDLALEALSAPADAVLEVLSQNKAGVVALLRPGGDWEDLEETVRIVRTPCRFGSTRPYFVCPGVVNGVACGRRVAKLHGPGRYFLCRQCYRLAYASQNEGSRDRALRRSNKIRQHLNGDPGSANTFPERPKSMWRQTYERLRSKSIDAETFANEASIAQAVRLLGNLGKPERKRNFWS